MRGRIAAVVVVAGAVMYASSMGRANAAGDSVSCVSTSVDQTNMNADGTECQTMVSGAGPNKATAKASGLGTASATARNGATVSANATANSEADCSVAAGLGSATSSGLDAFAKVQISPAGGGKAKATGPNSMATSKINGSIGKPMGGNVQSTASGGSTAFSDVESANGGSAITNAKTGSSATAVTDLDGGGEAKAASNGTGAQAISTADANCKSSTNAKGANSTAVATCQDAGSVVSASATNGSIAVGSDTAPPSCAPMPGGKAKVRSPMGNCG